MSAINFGLGLLDLYSGANFKQIDTRHSEDNRKPYEGKKIPLSVTFSCTHRCNLVCIHCQAENSDTADEIPSKRFVELIDEIADAGCQKIGFTGGEPLIRKDIGEALERCYARGMVTTLVTNGFPVFKYIDQLEKLSLLFISLDGNQEVNDRIRGEKSFEKFLEAVKLAKSRHIPVCALTTLTSMNYDVVDEMCKIVEDLGIHWMIGVIQTRFTGFAEQDFKQGQLEKMLERVSKVKNLRTSKTYMDFVLGKRAMSKCFAGIGYAIIAPTGKIFPCFPAQFDHASYSGISVLDRNFGEAFQELPLYRATCDTCALACHIETNYLYLFNPDNIRQSFRLTKPITNTHS